MLSNFALWILVLLAVINGCNIVVNRVLNTRLGMHIGHLRSSYWNHLVGALFLVPFAYFMSNATLRIQSWGQVPLYLYLGGIVGVFFVWAINWVMPRLGVFRSLMILLTSQMVFGLIFDIFLGKIKSVPIAFLGIALILVGMFIGRTKE